MLAAYSLVYSLFPGLGGWLVSLGEMWGDILARRATFITFMLFFFMRICTLSN